MATRVWGAGSGAGSDGDWNTAANWTGDMLPVDGDIVIFDGAVCALPILMGNQTLLYLNTLSFVNYLSDASKPQFLAYVRPYNLYFNENFTADSGFFSIQRILGVPARDSGGSLNFGSWTVPPLDWIQVVVTDPIQNGSDIALTWISLDSNWGANAQKTGGFHLDCYDPTPNKKITVIYPNPEIVNIRLGLSADDNIIEIDKTGINATYKPYWPVNSNLGLMSPVMFCSGGGPSGNDGTIYRIKCSSLNISNSDPNSSFYQFVSDWQMPKIELQAASEIIFSGYSKTGYYFINNLIYIKGSVLFETPKITFKDHAYFGAKPDTTLPYTVTVDFESLMSASKIGIFVVKNPSGFSSSVDIKFQDSSVYADFVGSYYINYPTASSPYYVGFGGYEPSGAGPANPQGSDCIIGMYDDSSYLVLAGNLTSTSSITFYGRSKSLAVSESFGFYGPMVRLIRYLTENPTPTFLYSIKTITPSSF